MWFYRDTLLPGFHTSSLSWTSLRPSGIQPTALSVTGSCLRTSFLESTMSSDVRSVPQLILILGMQVYLGNNLHLFSIKRWKFVCFLIWSDTFRYLYCSTLHLKIRQGTLTERILYEQGQIPAPWSAAIIYWYLGNRRGWLIDLQKKILLDGLMGR